jgi:hypothetical protein
MKRRAAARIQVWLVFVCLTAIAHAQLMEQTETGHRSLPNGTEISYRVRLLPPASFPSLPLAVLRQLSTRRCLIPQTYEAHQPENVIHGAFRAGNSDDWAVLCSFNGTTTLYVFFGDQPESPATLRSQPDNEWLGASYAGATYGSAWGITVRHSESIPAGKPFGSVDHDGIEDARIEKSSQVHYYRDGKWLTVSGGD